MLKKYKEWRKKKQQQKNQQKFNDGFNWAMDSFYIDKMAYKEIKNYN